MAKKSKAASRKKTSSSGRPARGSKRAKPSALKSRQEQSPSRSDRDQGMAKDRSRGEKDKNERSYQGRDEPYVSRDRDAEAEDFERGTGSKRGKSRFDTDEESENSRTDREQARESSDIQDRQKSARHGSQSEGGQGRKFEDLEYQSEDQGRSRTTH